MERGGRSSWLLAGCAERGGGEGKLTGYDLDEELVREFEDVSASGGWGR